MTLILIGLAYVVGSLPFAVIVSRALKLPDPREYGSKNPGATNVLRGGSKLAALLTVLGDGAKGYLAVWLVQRAGAPEPVIAASAVAVFLGHLFPLFLRFRGGKGVATSLGAWLALDPVLGVAALGVWALTATLTRLSSAAALVAAIVAPVVCWWRHGAEPLTFAVIIMAALLMLRHKANIRNLLARSETKIGSRRDASL